MLSRLSQFKTFSSILSVSVQSQVAERLSVRQFFEAIGETITSRRTLKSATVFGSLVYLQ